MRRIISKLSNARSLDFHDQSFSKSPTSPTPQYSNSCHGSQSFHRFKLTVLSFVLPLLCAFCGSFLPRLCFFLPQEEKTRSKISLKQPVKHRHERSYREQYSPLTYMYRPSDQRHLHFTGDFRVHVLHTMGIRRFETGQMERTLPVLLSVTFETCQCSVL